MYMKILKENSSALSHRAMVKTNEEFQDAASRRKCDEIRDAKCVTWHGWVIYGQPHRPQVELARYVPLKIK